MSAGPKPLPFDQTAVAGVLERFLKIEADLVAATREETGFTLRDARELTTGARSVLEAKFAEPIGPTSAASLPGRVINLHQRPFGGVAIVLPLNAFPYMALLAGLNALAAGNRVWLKAPSACVRSIDLVKTVFGDTFDGQIELVDTPGREFMDWALGSPEVHMIHFIGGSDAASNYLKPTFDAGKTLLIDGDGNCQVFVGATADPNDAGRLLAAAATRFNGQTCTSTVGAVIHPNAYEATFDVVKSQFESLKTGDSTDPDVNVGPLFSAAAVDAAMRRVNGSGGTIATGGTVNGNALRPTLVQSPDLDSDLVRSGAFAPVLWVAEGGFIEFEQVWSQNRFPLCAGVLSNDPADVDRAATLPRLSRLTVNGDTSDEDPLEPWGASPSSGNGRVDGWLSRYTRTVQIDQPIDLDLTSS